MASADLYMPPSPYKGLFPYSETDRLFFFGREEDREKITDNLTTWRLTILYGESGVGKSSVLRAGVAYHLRQAAQKNADISGKPEWAIIVFPPAEDKKVSWQDPLNGIKEQLKFEIARLLDVSLTEIEKKFDVEINSFFKDLQSPPQKLSLVDTLKAWTRIIPREEGNGRLFIILDQFEEYFVYLSQKDGKDSFLEEFSQAVNDPELSANFLVAIRSDSLTLLDKFRANIWNLFKNRLAIKHLNRESAIEAINKPIHEYNRQKIILENLLDSRLTILAGRKNTHKSTILRSAIKPYLRKHKLKVVLFNDWRISQNHDLLALLAFWWKWYCKIQNDRPLKAEALDLWFISLAYHLISGRADLLTVFKNQIAKDLDNNFPTPKPELSLVETLKAWTKPISEVPAESELFIILDQFEDYFWKQAEIDPDKTFISELLSAIHDNSLNVKFLMAIREDWLSELDSFADSIPCRYYLHLYRDEEEGIDRIEEKPIIPESIPLAELEKRQQVLTEKSINIDSDLVEKILDDVRQAGPQGTRANGSSEAPIETPYLQLVMDRLWKEEMSCIQREDREWQEGNRAAPPLRQLQKTTYADTDKLGGAKKIVKDHLYSKLEQDSLSESDREAAARIFNYLVTPSGAKIAQSVSDLVGYANENLTGDRSKLDCKPVSELLDKLTTGESRILRRVGSSDQPYEQHYEIFHDVLGQAVLEWRRDYWERKQKEDLEKLKKDVQEILGILPASMRSLSPKEKDIAAECFPYLVHAYSVADLAEQVGCESTQLADLLDKFAENRIVRLVGPPPDKPEDQQYQIFHDLLTPAIMEWRRAYLERKKQQERKRKQRRRQSIAIVVGIGVIALVGWQGRIAYQAKVDLVTAESRQVLEKFDAGQQLVALQQGMRSGRWTETWVKNNPLSSIFLSQDKKRQLLSQSTFALQQTLARIQEQNQFSDPSAQLQCWNFSRDGQTLAIGSADGTVQLWNLQTGSKLTSFRASGQLLDLGFSPDGRTLATISADGTVQRWDWRTGKEQARFPTSGSIWTLHFSPSSPVLAIALADGTVQLWNWQTGSQLTSFKASEQVFALRFSPSSPVLAIALADGTVQLWNWETDTTQIAFKASGPVSSLRFSRDSDGQTLAAITRGRTVQLWNPQKGPTPFNKPGRVESLSLNSNGQILAAGSSDGTVQLWDWQTGQKHGQFKASGPVNYLYFGPDDQSLVTVLADGTLSLWALSKGEWQTLPKSSGRVFDLSFSPNGQILATAAPVEGKVQLWDWKTGKLQTELPADRALSLSFSPDGQTLATGSADGTIQVWDWKTRKERAKLKASSPVRSLNFSSDGKTLTTFSVDGTVQLWNWKTGKEGSNFNVSGLVLSLGFSPDGQTLATGSADGTVQLGDWQANKQLNSFSIGSGAVSSLSFSPDGRTLAIASGDGAILSDLNGNQLAQFKTAGYVLGLRFSRDGKTLATTSSEGIVNLWPVEDFVKDLDDLLVRGCKWLRPYLESHPDEGKDLPCQRK